MSMKIKWLDEKMNYDGSQLRPLFSYLEKGMAGASVLGFRGACDVSFANMIDGEDLVSQSRIAGQEMLHVLVEFFHQNLFSAVVLQRLIADITRNLVLESTGGKVQMLRRGDDLYVDDRKFSISIATVSPVSQMLHFAVNITQEGTPVKTCALNDFGIDPQKFGPELLKRIALEFDDILAATEKVLPAH